MAIFGRSAYLLHQRNGRWTWPWLFVGLIAAVVGFIIVTIAFAGILGLAMAVTDWAWADEVWDSFFAGESTEAVSTRPDVLSIELLLTGALFWGAALFGTLAHRLPIRSLVSPSRPFRWDIARTAVYASLVLTVAVSLVGVLRPSETTVTFTGMRAEQLAWLLPLLACTLVQTSGEDVFFKGLLLHRIGAVMPVAWLAAIATSAVFVALHIGNADLDDLWLILPVFILSELIIIYLVVRTGGMEAALVLHFVNNALIFVVIAEKDTQANDVTFFVTETPGAAEGVVTDEVIDAVMMAVYFAVLLGMFVWKKSPFFLERYDPPVPGEVPDGEPSGVRPSAGVAQAGGDAVDAE